MCLCFIITCADYYLRAVTQFYKLQWSKHEGDFEILKVEGRMTEEMIEENKSPGRRRDVVFQNSNESFVTKRAFGRLASLRTIQFRNSVVIIIDENEMKFRAILSRVGIVEEEESDGALSRVGATINIFMIFLHIIIIAIIIIITIIIIFGGRRGFRYQDGNTDEEVLTKVHDRR